MCTETEIYYKSGKGWMFLLASVRNSTVNVTRWRCRNKSLTLEREFDWECELHLITTIVSNFSPTNINNETVVIFYNDLSFLVRHIHSHNALIISRSMNSHRNKDGYRKFYLYKSSNRLENKMVYPNTCGECVTKQVKAKWVTSWS